MKTATATEDISVSLEELHWWQTGVIYQVYPRSFYDSNDDGSGDLQGIIQKLPYLKWLGVTAIWISPVYPSPMKDFGYDITDYTGIDPLFGSPEDMTILIDRIHDLKMKVILDLVPNHSSDLHPWFLESRASRQNPKRNWYIWKDGDENEDPPNNWLSVFGGSAWQWDAVTGQYYYHAFLKEQPDLNWRNEEVLVAMIGVMRFWLDKGVDGFRIDVMWHLIKDKQFRNNPPNPHYDRSMADYEQLLPLYSTDQPEVHGIVETIRHLLDQYQGRMMIGEIYLPVRQLVTYYGKNNNGAHLPFNFLLLSLSWDSLQIAAAIDEYEAALPPDAWPNWVIGNHDKGRITGRVGFEQSRIAAVLLLTLRGTPTIYYGDEIAMRDVPVPSSEIQDPQGLLMPEKHLSRDPERSPMQWDDTENAGFTKGKPWLRLDKSYRRRCVQVEQRDPYSMLSLYARLIQLRGEEPSLTRGHYIRVHADHQTFIYKRQAQGYDGFLIALNFSHRPSYYQGSARDIAGIVEFSVDCELDGSLIEDQINLDGDQGIIVRLARPGVIHKQ